MTPYCPLNIIFSSKFETRGDKITQNKRHSVTNFHGIVVFRDQKSYYWIFKSSESEQWLNITLLIALAWYYSISLNEYKNMSSNRSLTSTTTYYHTVEKRPPHLILRGSILCQRTRVRLYLFLKNLQSVPLIKLKI